MDASVNPATFVIFQEEIASQCVNATMKSESNAAGISAASQAVNQLTGLGLVLISALLSGLATGFLLKLKLINQVREKELYADGDYFETPADYDFNTRIVSRIDRVEINEHTQLTQKEI
ncbi:hypothetical protein NECAME_14077 [Necator americanus]|uniref:Ammonium transporter AmtB-like domain-containing protein n=1 Tax=Necator americanus TaxID=51031 RepID=W2SSL0_NECAM|nr:hypothetical protein NECAME_14077 [Necator americanus]ETN71806.1 hypothetical protein NECAME_14077 [Necator americanus]